MKIIPLFAAMFLFTGCKKEITADNTFSKDSTAIIDQTTVEIDSSATPPTNYGDEGRLYASADGKTKFRILSEDLKEETLNFRDENSGVIYEMKQVNSASGSKYEDANGNFIWFKGKEFTFGKGETNVSSGSLEK